MWFKILLLLHRESQSTEIGILNIQLGMLNFEVVEEIPTE